MFGPNRFAEFFARDPSAPPPSRRRDRSPWCAEDLFESTSTEAVPNLADTGRSFAESVCEQLGLHPNQYENEVFRRCLYPKARALLPLLQFYNPSFFAPDRDFIRRVGKVRRREDLTRELDEFYYHPRNVGWMRRRFNLRISCRKLVALVREAMPELRPRGSAGNGYSSDRSH
jgi:hypothetical protein